MGGGELEFFLVLTGQALHGLSPATFSHIPRGSEFRQGAFQRVHRTDVDVCCCGSQTSRLGEGRGLTLKDSRKLLQSSVVVVRYPCMQELLLGRLFPEVLHT